MSPRLTLVAAAAAVVTAAWAASPHFISATGTVDSGGQLDVAFKEAGVGDNLLIDYRLNTVANATFACYNNGTQQPQGSPFDVQGQGLTAFGQYSSGKNGQINATISAGPPGAGEGGAKCLSTGIKQLCMLYVSYSSSTLTDLTNNVFIGVTPDPNFRSFPTPTKQQPSPANCVSS